MLSRLQTQVVKSTTHKPGVPSSPPAGFEEVLIETFPHSRQRYNTVGDWTFFKNAINATILSIKVSRMQDWRYGMMVAVHELVEAILCTADGVTPEMVDEFDMAHEQDPEPGDLSSNPCHRQHLFATRIEKMLCRKLGIPWRVYDAEVERVWQTR